MSGQSFFHKQVAGFVGRMVGTITGVRTEERVAALTFDDGPHPEFTPRLLEILARHNACATFFVVGKSAVAYHKIVEDVIQAGHSLGIHSWDHPSFVKISVQEQRKQLLSCIEAIAPYKSRIFRPPYGHQTPLSHLNVRSIGCEVIGWDLDVADWLFHDASSLVDALFNKLLPGNIVLLHDAIYLPETGVNSNRQATLDAVDLLLGRLGGDMKFVTVPDLFSYGKPKRENWYRN